MFASDHGFATSGAPTEAKVLTRDGRMWPVERVEMRDPHQIRLRMLEDLDGCPGRRSVEAITAWLLIYGWRCAQIDAHAADLLKEVRHA